MAKQTIANTPEADSASVYIGADAANKWVKVKGSKLATKAQLEEVGQVADNAKTMATTAKGTAETADRKATDAKSIASDAGRLAGTANSNAIDAKNKATAAQTAATNAQNASNDAATSAVIATKKATEAVVAANSVTGDIDKIWGRMRKIYTPEMTEQHDYPVSALWFYNGLTVPTSSIFPTNTAGTYDSIFIPTGNGASEVKLRVKGLSYAEDAVLSVLVMCQKLTLYAENTELGYITRGSANKTFGWLCFSVRIVQGGIFAITEMANCTFTLTYAGTEYRVLVPSMPTVDSALSSSSENPVQNKVVKAALDGKSGTSHTHSAASNTAAGFMSVLSYRSVENMWGQLGGYLLTTITIPYGHFLQTSSPQSRIYPIRRIIVPANVTLTEVNIIGIQKGDYSNEVDVDVYVFSDMNVKGSFTVNFVNTAGSTIFSYTAVPASSDATFPYIFKIRIITTISSIYVTQRVYASAEPVFNCNGYAQGIGMTLSLEDTDEATPNSQVMGLPGGGAIALICGDDDPVKSIEDIVNDTETQEPTEEA